MQANMEVNPADIRFTQDSINLYFQFPYNEFSVREAVRKLSRKEMRPDDFPPIRVNSSGGCLWSIDNRRLWVFRLARCSSINVNLVKKMHPRVKDVLSDEDLHSMMQVEDFFPRLRDRGKKDLKFDQRFPQPVSSLQLPVDEALEKPPINVAQVSNVDTEILWTMTMHAKPSINPVEEHKYGQSDRGKEDLKFDQRFPQPAVSSLQLSVNEALEKPPVNVAQVSNVDIEISGTITMPGKSPINPVVEHKHGQIEINIDEERGTPGPTKPSIHLMEDLERMITDAAGSFFSFIFDVPRKIANAGRMIRNVVGSVFFKIISGARRAAAAVSKTITDSVGSFFSKVSAVARRIVSAVHKYFW